MQKLNKKTTILIIRLETRYVRQELAEIVPHFYYK